MANSDDNFRPFPVVGVHDPLAIPSAILARHTASPPAGELAKYDAEFANCGVTGHCRRRARRRRRDCQTFPLSMRDQGS